MWPEYFAISYRNPRNGALEGIDIDMARALAAGSASLRFVETNFADSWTGWNAPIATCQRRAGAAGAAGAGRLLPPHPAPARSMA